MRKPADELDDLEPADDLAPGIVNHLAVFGGDEPSQLVGVLMHQLTEGEHNPRALPARHRSRTRTPAWQPERRGLHPMARRAIPPPGIPVTATHTGDRRVLSPAATLPGDVVLDRLQRYVRHRCPLSFSIMNGVRMERRSRGREDSDRTPDDQRCRLFCPLTRGRVSPLGKVIPLLPIESHDGRREEPPLWASSMPGY